ncbi:MAG: hypothetical protein KQJ78_07865 [Deltaproteobacteria bacterium]|nr:hypothetical protein [Deltaproteobacteria bacterium]MCB2186318.1 hypothetical protein [Deltaproteobacteria bacterium]
MRYPLQAPRLTRMLCLACRKPFRGNQSPEAQAGERTRDDAGQWPEITAFPASFPEVMSIMAFARTA